MNLTKKQSNIAVGVLIAFFMAMVMSFVMVLINLGWVQSFFLIWMKSFAVSFAVAVPTSMVAASVSQKLIGRLS